MTRKSDACVAIEHALIAAATGEAAGRVAERVATHVAGCAHCREDYAHYRALDAAVGELRSAPADDDAGARTRLLARLGDLRSRLVRWSVFDSALGPILIAATETGISLVEYLDRRGAAGSRLFHQTTLEPEEDRAAVEPFHRDLDAYLTGGRTTLDWTLDWRLATSDFHRAVLAAAAAVPYGAVSSYAGIAHDIGKPAAVRAVAQALRYNPLPIVVPCHRIIGSSGALVGYAGHRVGLKERLLDLEGVPTEHGRRDVRVTRAAMYAWDRSDRWYCLPTCGEIPQQPIGRVTLIASVGTARALGLHPCQDCRPDLHPLEAR
jgi:O-6-methylguanine DNA methyltransferase